MKGLASTYTKLSFLWEYAYELNDMKMVSAFNTRKLVLSGNF